MRSTPGTCLEQLLGVRTRTPSPLHRRLSGLGWNRRSGFDTDRPHGDIGKCEFTVRFTFDPASQYLVEFVLAILLQSAIPKNELRLTRWLRRHRQRRLGSRARRSHGPPCAGTDPGRPRAGRLSTWPSSTYNTSASRCTTDR